MRDYFESLNEEQKEAVRTTEGPVRVIAGAGTGKTRALTGRYCYLVDMLGVAPKNILCVTFTNRAAGEMKARIRRALGEDLDLGYVCTIHAFCVQLLKEDANVLHFPKNFIILDTEDQKDMLQKVFQDMHLSLRDAIITRTIDEVLEMRKMKADSYIADFYLMDNEKLKERFAEAETQNDEIFLRYIYEQKKCFGLDFNDIINFAWYILKNFPDIREKWQKRMQYVMVDEFQDVSAKQYSIVRYLSGYHRNLFIVGDPDQTIYTWRGSHMKIFLEFDRENPGTKTILLDRNYRSVPEILRASDEMIAHNKLRYPKVLRAERPDFRIRLENEKHPADRLVRLRMEKETAGAAGVQAESALVFHVAESVPAESGHVSAEPECVPAESRPVWIHTKSAKEEACAIVKEIEAYVEAGGSFQDIGILYRAHYLSRPIEEELVRRKIPYRIYSGVAFYGRREVKDVLCYLRMLTDADDVAFLRTVNLPARKIGKKKIEYLRARAEETGKSLYETLKSELDSPEMKGTGAVRYVNAIETVREMMAKSGKIVSIGMPFDKDENPLADICQAIMDRSGYGEYLRIQGDQDRLDNVAELLRAVREAGEDPDMDLADFLRSVALYTNADKDEMKMSVKLMTVHTSKGMEFPVIFIAGLSEGIFPSRKVLMPEDMDEERRLMYVAMTRAKDLLYLTDSEGADNDNLFKYPSRFISECGKENLHMINPPEEELLVRANRYVREDEKRLSALGDVFEPGTVVEHEVFGRGTVLSADTKAGSYEIQFEGLPTPRTMRLTAPLKRA